MVSAVTVAGAMIYVGRGDPQRRRENDVGDEA